MITKMDWDICKTVWAGPDRGIYHTNTQILHDNPHCIMQGLKYNSIAHPTKRDLFIPAVNFKWDEYTSTWTYYNQTGGPQFIIYNSFAI